MRNILTLITALVFISATVHADDTRKNKKNKPTVAAAPFVLGDPGEEAPSELAFTKVVNTLVLVAPFVWGNSEDAPEIVEIIKIKNSLVPVAPFTFGNPDDEIILDLKTALAVQK